jgi:hypothetical protein
MVPVWNGVDLAFGEQLLVSRTSLLQLVLMLLNLFFFDIDAADK